MMLKPQADGLRLERVHEMDLTAEQDRAIAALIAGIMRADYDGRSFFQNRHHRRYLMWDGNTLVGHLAVCFRAIRLGDTLADIIGIAEVATHHDYRRRGIASALLQAALDDGRASLADFACLFGIEKLYERAGFRPAGNLLRISETEAARAKGVVEEANPAFKVLPLKDREWDDAALVDLAGWAF